MKAPLEAGKSAKFRGIRVYSGPVERPTAGRESPGTTHAVGGASVVRRLEDNPMADKSITKTELVASIASATGQSQAAVSGVLDSLFTTVSEAVAKGSKVSIPGWIAFEQVDTAARTGRNPQTGEEIKIAAGKRVKVTAGSKLKAAVK
ncbi:DNA-binding protein [Microbacterium sp. TS-1]|nr:DNA-binding protein [Microbacterium sp. TS-1]